MRRTVKIVIVVAGLIAAVIAVIQWRQPTILTPGPLNQPVAPVTNVAVLSPLLAFLPTGVIPNDTTNATDPDPYTTNTIRIDTITPGSGTYGVAIPITVTFTKPVKKQYRADIEQRLTVTTLTESTHEPVTVPGAWSWRDNQTVTYRPEQFWPAHTEVTVNANLSGQYALNTGTQQLTKYKGGKHTVLHIDRDLRINVDGNTHQSTVTINGKTKRTIPISLGKTGWETRTGIKVIHERYREKRMTSQAIGADETYDLIAPYAMRLTQSGEFIHGAPWATGRIGRVNGSHGCTNVTVSDAQWLYNNTLPGDPVITVNAGKPVEPWNGWGGPWNVPWNKWLARSALATP